MQSLTTLKYLKILPATADVVQQPRRLKLPATLLSIQNPEVYICSCGISAGRCWLTPVTILKATLLQEKLF
jgi:hypothetical protein